jgi:DNA helicase HerA-like ATPase
MQDYEKLGLFYLGKIYDLKQRAITPDLMLYESKDLTTHAVCLGMTGSGKTGLGIALLEEAAIDGIPVIAIDPKGDLGNLLLGFPELRAEDFLPWIDLDEATRQHLTLEQFATHTAEQWRKGLADWDQDGARIARLRETIDLAIYTPGSSAGLPLAVLRSFDAPPPALVSQVEAYGNASARRFPAFSLCWEWPWIRSLAGSTFCSRTCSITPGARGITLTWQA